MGSLIDTSVLAGARAIGEIADNWAVSVVTVGELEAGVLIAQDERVRPSGSAAGSGARRSAGAAD